MGPLMINMAFMPLYMWEMWDVTPVTHGHTDGRTVESSAVFSLSWIRKKTHYLTCTWQTHCLAPLRKEQSEQLSPEVVSICDERHNVLVCPCKFPSHLNGLLCNDLFSFTIICVLGLAIVEVGFVVFHFKPITGSPHYTKSLNKTLSYLVVIYKLSHNFV